MKRHAPKPDQSRRKVVNGIEFFWAERLQKWVTVPEDGRA